MHNGVTLAGPALAERLRGLESDLRNRGIARMDVFGSRARGDHARDSDVDLLIDLDPRQPFTLLDLVRLERWLCGELGLAAHVETWSSVPDYAKAELEGEAVPVF